MLMRSVKIGDEFLLVQDDKPIGKVCFSKRHGQVRFGFQSETIKLSQKVNDEKQPKK